MATEIRQRNPDIPLTTAIELAKSRLGYSDQAEESNDSLEENTEPTLQEKITAIEQALTEAGANEGLFTPEVAELTKEHARLMAQNAVEQIQGEQIAQREADLQEKEHIALTQLMQQSSQRVFEICPAAQDSNSEIGRAITQVIEKWKATNNPEQFDPNAPELIFAAANMTLPPERRVSVTPIQELPKHATTAEAKKPKVQNTSEATFAQPVEPPAPTARALPVSAAARTAQPDTLNLNQAQMSQLVREASKDDLATIEEALYGVSGRDVLLRI